MVAVPVAEGVRAPAVAHVAGVAVELALAAAVEVRACGEEPEVAAVVVCRATFGVRALSTSHRPQTTRLAGAEVLAEASAEADGFEAAVADLLGREVRR